MFNNARLKLTSWYLLILMLISIFFSLVIYRSIAGEIDRFSHIQTLRYENVIQRNNLYTKPTIRFIDPDIIEEAKHRLFVTLIFINFGIFFVVGSLSYVLAGKTLKPIQEMMEEQNRFISDASHEFRTPLTALKSSLEVNLRDNNLTVEEAKKIMGENIHDVNHLQKLSDSLLQLSHYEKPQIFSDFENVSLKQTIHESINKIIPLANKKNISIKSNLVDINIVGNKYGLIDLFIILLDNGVKYSKEKSTILIESKKVKRSVFISFKDHGIGIDKKDLPHLFDRFYRTDKARSKKEVDGYGLGLSIAKKIVDQHYGTIEVESKLKKGTTFNIWLPICR